MTLRDRVELPRLYWTWHTAPQYHEGDADLDLACKILGSGSSSRLYKRLVHEEELAQDVSFRQESQQLVSVAILQVTLAPGSNANDVERIVDEELGALHGRRPHARGARAREELVRGELHQGRAADRELGRHQRSPEPLQPLRGNARLLPAGLRTVRVPDEGDRAGSLPAMDRAGADDLHGGALRRRAGGRGGRRHRPHGAAAPGRGSHVRGGGAAAGAPGQRTAARRPPAGRAPARAGGSHLRLGLGARPGGPGGTGRRRGGHAGRGDGAP